MNLQVIATPGAVPDLTAALIWGIVRELAASGLIVLADKGPLARRTARQSHPRPSEPQGRRMKKAHCCYQRKCRPYSGNP